MGYFAKVSLTLSGMADAEAFKAQTAGLSNASTHKQGERFSEHQVCAHDYMALNRHSSEHVVAEEQIKSLFSVLPGYLPFLLPSYIRRQLHVTIFAQGSQGGGLHLDRELLREIACYQAELIVTHHQIPNYGENEPFALRVPCEMGVELERQRSCHAHLTVLSPNLSPSEITSRVGLSPTASAVKDPSHRMPGRQFMNQWDLSSRPHVHSLNLTDHLRWLVDQLDTVKSNIQQLSLDTDLNLGGISLTGYFPAHHRMVWPADLLRRVAALNLWLDFDHYFLDEGDRLDVLPPLP